MLSIFDEKSHVFLKKMLDISTQRQNLISHNIANVNTPGFKRSDLDFNAQLREVLSDDGDIDKLKDFQGTIVKPDITPVRRDGNNVDLNKELSIVAQNSILFKVYVQAMKGRFTRLKEAMRSPQ